MIVAIATPTAHLLPAHDGVLHGVGERVSEMEGARDVGRGDDNDELGLVGAVLRLEELALLPPLVPGRLHNLRVVPAPRPPSPAPKGQLRGSKCRPNQGYRSTPDLVGSGVDVESGLGTYEPKKQRRRTAREGRKRSGVYDFWKVGVNAGVRKAT
eukprot:749838-Prorocentrum_minimum.AAC.10